MSQSLFHTTKLSNFVLLFFIILVALSACKDDTSSNKIPGAVRFVSTEPQNKKVLIEEHTGTGCGFCPDAHRIVDDLAKEFADNLFHVNIHTYNATYRIPDGNLHLNAFPTIVGYPQAIVNRKKVSGNYFTSRIA
jgi:thiol-disulfide isomerase/thioredoxin